MRTEKLWRPESSCPWRALKKGTDTYVWYEIVDCDGWDVCSLGAVRYGTEEHDELFRQMAHILCTVNKTNVIQIGDEKINIHWHGEQNGQPKSDAANDGNARGIHPIPGGSAEDGRDHAGAINPYSITPDGG
jgi:hypothetical protein